MRLCLKYLNEALLYFSPGNSLHERFSFFFFFILLSIGLASNIHIKEQYFKTVNKKE